MKCNCTLLKPVLVVVIFACIGNFASAQNCTVNAGIPQQYCNVTSFDLIGNQGGDFSPTPNLQWTQVGGSPTLTINNAGSLTTLVSNVVPGVFVFRLSATCEDGVTNFNDVTITVLPPPTIALAGSDQQVCNSGSINLSGNAPSGLETGTWSVVSGGGSVTNPNNANAIFNAPGKGVFELEWEIDNGSCATRDTVVITVAGGAQPVSAGADKTITCSGSATTLEGSDPGLSPQSGLWTFVSGPSIANIQSPTSAATGVNGLIIGTYVFRWTVSGPCFSGSDEVTIIVSDIKASPSSGGNKTQTFCEEDNVTQVVLNAAPMAGGETGLWTQTGGPAATIASPATSTTQVTGLDGSSQYTFVWTVSNSGGCTAVATHRLVFVPDFSSMTDPPNQVLGCRQHSTTVNIQYDYGGITSSSGLTRTGRLLTSPLTNTSGVKIERSGNVGNDTWTITGLDSAGLYSFLFEYRNACSAVFKTVGVLVSDTGAVSNAGADIVLPCNEFTTTLAAAAPPDGQGIGEWSKVSGPPAVIQSPNSPTTPVALTIDGVYIFRWSISNGPACVSQIDEVTVTESDATIDTINAGSDTSFCVGISYTMQALIPGATITGTWSNFPANVTVSDIHAPNAVISNLTSGQTVDFIWTLSNACGTIKDTVTISATENFAVQANAGPDQCLDPGTTTAQLSGNDPGSGIPFWTSLDGPNLNGTQQQNPIATIPALPLNASYRFVYSILSPGCGVNTDTVLITRSAAASTANAGPDQDICASSLPTSATLNATPPTIGTGFWTQTSGSAGPVIVNPDQPQTQVNNLANGIYNFAYTITNGACPGNADTVRIVISETLGAVNAGPDQDLCDITTGTNVQLNATPVDKPGVWTVQSGPGGSAPIFSDNTSATSTVRNLQNGIYVLRWSTVTGAGCPVFFDEVTLNVTARANANTTASGACDVTTVTLIGNLNTDGNWTQVSGPNTATIANDNPNNFSAIASGMITGTYVFNYSLPAIGGCPASNDDVTVTVYQSPTPANAGANIELCPGITSTTVTGNTPAVGTVSWTRVSGPNTPTESGNNTPTLDLSNLVPGVYIYTYTISNGNCPASTDNVGIVVANAAAAGNDQQLCAATTATLAGNVPVVYTGTWTQSSGPNTANFSDAANPTTPVNNLITGTYTFRWTINTPGTCPANFDEVTVVIDPTLDITGVAGADQTVCEGGGNLTIGTNTGPNDATYSWQPATLLTDATSQHTTFTGTGAGTYNYTLVATRGSCQSSDQVTITINQVPVQPVLNAPSNICENATTTISVVSVQTGVTYNWTGDFVGTGTSQIVGPGAYTVTPVFDIGGCPGLPASKTIIGDQLPTTAAAGTDQDICQDISSATLTGNIAVVGQSLWTQVNGPNTATITPTPANRVIDISGLIPGVYTFEYSISNGTCPTSTDQVIVRKELVANAGSDQRLCNASSANLAGNMPFIYPGQWTQISKPAGAPDATIVSPTNPSTAVNGLTFGLSLSGTYVFRWTIESGAVCPTNSDDITIIVDAPVVTANAGSNIIRCQGDPAVITLGSGVFVPGYTYTWTPSLDLVDPNASQTEFTGVDPGRYDFTLTVSNNTCSASDDVSIIINALPETPIISAPLAACANGTATVVITNPTPDADYTWRQGTTVVANGDSVELGPGSYTVTPTSLEGCVAPPVPLTLGSNAPPVASFTTSPAGCRFEYTATDIGPGSSYTFYFGPDANPSLVTGIGPHLISYYPAGVKKVYLLTIDANGCRDTTSEDVVVPCFSFSLPLNLVSFNGEWRNQYPALTWEADNSTNMSHFEVERSTDGINFNTVRNVPISNVSILVRYNYTDSSVSPLENIYYYRLKIVENTGAITYSHIIRLQARSRLIVEVNPNPFIDKLSIAINTARTTKGVLSLIAVNGSTIKTQQISLQQGTNRIEMQNLSGLPGGRYFLRVQIGDEIKTYKLLKL